MAHLEPDARCLDETPAPRRTPPPGLDRRVRRFVGHGEVRPEADDVDRTLGLEPQGRRQERGQVRRREAVAAQAGVDLELHPGGQADRAGRVGHLVERPGGGDRQVDVGLDRVLQRRARGVEPGQDARSGDARATQLERLADLGRAQPGRAAGDRRLRGGDQAVAVGVGLDDGHDLRGRGVGGERGHVAADRGEVDDGARGELAHGAQSRTAFTVACDDDVGPVRRRGDQPGVHLVGTVRPRPRGLGRLAERLVPGHEPLQPDVVGQRDEPRLVEQPGHRAEAVVVEEQVVALRDDERDVRRDRDRARDGIAQVAAVLGRVHRARLGAQAPQQRHVPGGVERVGRALAVGPADPFELGLGQVEAVHRDDDGTGPDRVDHLRREGGLPGARRTDDPEDPALARRPGARRAVPGARRSRAADQLGDRPRERVRDRRRRDRAAGVRPVRGPTVDQRGRRRERGHDASGPRGSPRPGPPAAPRADRRARHRHRPSRATPARPPARTWRRAPRRRASPAP